MASKRSVEEQFTQNWNKTASWAQASGISSSAYLPIYQMDVQRLQANEYPMSAAERHVGILAAQNPNNVPSAPTDNPQPSNVFGNARHDLGMIATGLEPTHLISGLFGTVENTIKAVLDPKREEGKNLGTTAANWLQNTLLSFIPGMYDIGTVLRADPTLSGSEGFKALADHPLLSLLDILPAEAGGIAAKTGLGARLADAAGITTEALAETSVTRAVSKALMNQTWGMKEGFSLDAAKGYHDLTIGETLQKWATNGVFGTSKPVQYLLKEFVTNNQLSTAVNQAMITPMVNAVSDLSTEAPEGQLSELAVYQEIWRRHQTENIGLDKLLRDPSVTPKVVAAVEETMKAQRFITDHAIASSDVVGIRRPDGSIGLYSTKGALAKIVIDAAKDKAKALDFFVKDLDESDKMVEWVTKSNQAVATLTSAMSKARSDSVTQFAKDEDRLKNVKQETDITAGRKKPKTETHVLGTRKETVDRVFGDGGLVDSVIQKLKEGDFDAVAAAIPTLKRALGKDWSYMAVDTSAATAFGQVADMVTHLDQILKERTKQVKAIEHRITGEFDRRVRESEEAKAVHAKQIKEMKERHKQELADLTAKKRMTKAQIKTARRLRMKNLDDLYERQKDAALEKWNNIAARATKAKADEAYQMYLKDEARLRSLWWESKNRENTRYDKMELQGELDVAKEVPGVIKRQDRERALLKEIHEGEMMYHGSLVEEYRGYVEALGRFETAVWEHPTDNYQSMEMKLFMDHLMENHKNATLVDLYYRKLQKIDEWHGGRVADLLRNPDLLKEQLWIFARDVYMHPDNFEAMLITDDERNFVKGLVDEVVESGKEELKLLIADGFDPMWLPRADALTDEVTGSAHFGITSPHVDVAHERVHDITATRHDTVLGVTRAMSQAIRRDAYVEFVNENLTPIAITAEDFATEMRKAYPDDPTMRFENLDTSKGTSLAALSATAKLHGLEKFDPSSIFPFTPPRWENKTLFLPEGMVKALTKTHEIMSKGDRGILDKPTQLFRYSILGLSPRYTAHILFGGTFLLALRSTPYMPMMLLDAIRGMKNGDLSERMFRAPTQEGVSRFGYAAQEYHIAGGKQLALLNVQEHISKVQGVLLSKASPFHYLKAAADINFKFTRYITRLQTSMAYLDYAARAERRGFFVDETTGQKMEMTPERAQMEGLHHVEAVFGDLRSMSPLERQIAKSVLPFYGWTRHILKYVMTLPADHPARAMILALIAYENSAEVPKGLPERIQNLFFLGSPDAQGNVTAVDARFLNPLRDVANYATLGGWIQALNPVLLAPLAMMDPQLVYGSTSLYPNLTFNDMYGIETAGAQGNAVSGLEQFVPQLGAIAPITAALSKAANVRKLASNPNAFYKSIFEDLNIPFAQVQKINVKQIAAKDAIARFEVAKTVASNAFQTGDFSALAGYKTVPYPLNPDYEVTPEQLAAIYNQALAQYPGQQPQNVLLPPPTPANY